MAQKAFLVGINKYPGAPLNGCLNDIQDMSKYLSECGFKSKDIRTLTDNMATTKAILDGLAWLVKGAIAGDRLFFQFSGHGVQVPTRNAAAEVDGLDEAICPVNFSWTDATTIRDKQFREIFATVPVGVSFLWVSDSCHSGDLSKDMPPAGQTPRTMFLPTGHPLADDMAKAKAFPKKKPVATRVNAALISGCTSRQTSADALIDGRYNGACTYYLLKILRSNPPAPLKDIVQLLNTELKINGYSQSPRLEGSKTSTSQMFFKP